LLRQRRAVTPPPTPWCPKNLPPASSRRFHGITPPAGLDAGTASVPPGRATAPGRFLTDRDL